MVSYKTRRSPTAKGPLDTSVTVLPLQLLLLLLPTPAMTNINEP